MFCSTFDVLIVLMVANAYIEYLPTKYEYHIIGKLYKIEFNIGEVGERSRTCQTQWNGNYLIKTENVYTHQHKWLI